ncbi:MAG: DUF58 domain-containing protein [Deltaproteobacteria bacterium]|nr:DUF58 domain-containing protein [Deltaproteobacteria bacterium]
MNFARFNHVLVPQSAAERMKWLSTGRHRWFFGTYRLYLALTPLGRGLLLFWLFAGALGLNVAQTVVYIMWSLITGLIGASLLLRRWFALPFVRVDVSAPARVQVGVPITFDVTLNNPGPIVRDIRMQSPFLTWDGKYVSVDEYLPVLPSESCVRLFAMATFSARGSHSLMPFMVTRMLPLGIAAGPTVQSGVVAFLVVPSFPKIHSLHMASRDRCHPGGVPMASHTGEAMELAGVRAYRTGDRVRDLHARTWGRTGVPHVKQYQQEFFTRLGIVLDVQQQGMSEAPFEGAISLTAGVLAHLAAKDALVDILCTGNRFYDLTIGRSVGFFQQGLDLLAAVQPGEPLKLEGIAQRLVHHIDKMSGVVIVTSFWGDSVRQVRQWCLLHNVPVRVLVVCKEKSNTAHDGVTQVSLADLKRPEGLWL